LWSQGEFWEEAYATDKGEGRLKARRSGAVGSGRVKYGQRRRGKKNPST